VNWSRLKQVSQEVERSKMILLDSGEWDTFVAILDTPPGPGRVQPHGQPDALGTCVRINTPRPLASDWKGGIR
jgi:hypothetical protein